jgi:hypothetical protein
MFAEGQKVMLQIGDFGGGGFRIKVGENLHNTTLKYIVHAS